MASRSGFVDDAEPEIEIECDDGTLKIFRSSLAFFQKLWKVPPAEGDDDLHNDHVRFSGVKKANVTTAMLMVTLSGDGAPVSTSDVGNVLLAMNLLGFKGLTYTTRHVGEGLMQLSLNKNNERSLTPTVVDQPCQRSENSGKSSIVDSDLEDLANLTCTSGSITDFTDIEPLTDTDTSADEFERGDDAVDTRSEFEEDEESENEDEGRKETIVHITLDSDGEEEDVEVEVVPDTYTKEGFLAQLDLYSCKSLLICEKCGRVLVSQETFDAHQEYHARPPKKIEFPLKPAKTKKKRKNKISSSSVDVNTKTYEKYMRFTPEDDRLLLELVQKHRTSWTTIAKYFPGRKCLSIADRYRYLQRRRPSSKKTDEPAQLPTEIGKSKPGKKKCRRRYERFTPEDDRRILELVKKNGNRWASMTKFFPGRHTSSLSNRYHSYICRQQSQVLPSEEAVTVSQEDDGKSLLPKNVDKETRPQPKKSPEKNKGKRRRKKYGKCWRFSPEEDKLIMECVQKFGKNWVLMGNFFPGRNVKCIAARYRYLLRRQQAPALISEKPVSGRKEDHQKSPIPEKTDEAPPQEALKIKKKQKSPSAKYMNRKRNRFSPEEDKLILECVKKFGKRWSTIVKFFPDRKSTAIAARYHYLLYRQRQRELSDLKNSVMGGRESGEKAESPPPQKTTKKVESPPPQKTTKKVESPRPQKTTKKVESPPPQKTTKKVESPRPQKTTKNVESPPSQKTTKKVKSPRPKGSLPKGWVFESHPVNPTESTMKSSKPGGRKRRRIADENDKVNLKVATTGPPVETQVVTNQRRRVGRPRNSEKRARKMQEGSEALPTQQNGRLTRSRSQNILN